MYHEGQFAGCRVKLPVQLGRRPEEPLDAGLEDFYGRLLRARGVPAFHEGDWYFLNATGWPDNSTSENLLAWSWRADHHGAIIVVNYSGASAQGLIRLPWTDLAGKTCQLVDALTSEVFVRDGDEMIGPGHFVDLGPWRTHFLTFEVP